MSSVAENKENLRLRMADLELKLAESEEERKKLEKTCNVLIRAFKEEEKIHYKALNLKYEKFLEDCKLRRKKNDIILRTLCRVEDRARALFAKTERLKLLKDRYATYLNLKELKKNEISYNAGKTFPYSSKTIRTENLGVEQHKSVHWKFPFVADLDLDSKIKKPASDITNFLGNGIYNKESPNNYDLEFSKETFYKSFMRNQDFPASNSHSKQDFQAYKKEDSQREIIGSGGLFEEENLKLCNDEDKLNVKKISLSNSQNSNDMLLNSTFEQFNYYEENIYKDKKSPIRIHQKNQKEEFFTNCFNESLQNYNSNINNVLEGNLNSNIELEFCDLKKAEALKEKSVVKHQESVEKLKTALSVEDNNENQEKGNVNLKRSFGYNNDNESYKKIIEKDEIETNEKSGKNTEIDLNVNLLLRTDNENPPCHFSPRTKIESSSFVETNGVEKNKTDFQQNPLRENVDQDENMLNEDFTKSTYSLPMGLDGVDYQNETYPESYYEQPEHHHNYSSIVSNVILEEDEYEQDIDQPELFGEPTENLFINETIGSFGKAHIQENIANKDNNTNQTFHSSTESFSRQNTDVCDELYANHYLQHNERDSDFYKQNKNTFNGNSQNSSSKTYGQLESQNFVPENIAENKELIRKLDISPSDVILNTPKKESVITNATQITPSNLVHLLESDSESFQIEHGGVVSGNEDSDFDFSFHQN